MSGKLKRKRERKDYHGKGKGKKYAFACIAERTQSNDTQWWRRALLPNNKLIILLTFSSCHFTIAISNKTTNKRCIDPYPVGIVHIHSSWTRSISFCINFKWYKLLKSKRFDQNETQIRAMYARDSLSVSPFHSFIIIINRYPICISFCIWVR